MRNAVIIRKTLLFSLFFIVAIYSLFQAQKLLFGPSIKIYSPKDGSTYSQTLIEVEGKATNVAYLNMNGNPIFTDKNGYFKEKFLLSPGYNVIKLDARDKFKKYTEKRLQIILKEY
jgi:hypothetical protein